MRLVFIIILILLIVPVSAWNWDNHQLIVQTIYYRLDDQTQLKLNLSELEKGSLAPDKDFHDNVLHHYPPSYEKSITWLEQAEVAFNIGDYNTASYAFGVAAHYISDSFSAPHNIAKEPSKLHSQFESPKVVLETPCLYQNYDLDQDLSKATENWKDWTPWLESRNEEIPKKEMEQSLELLFPIALDIFNAKCNKNNNQITSRGIYQETTIKKAPLVNKKAVIFLIILSSLFLVKKLRRN